MSIESREEELSKLGEDEQGHDPEPEKKPRKKREFKDAGQRVVLMAVNLPLESLGTLPPVDLSGENGLVTVWVQIGTSVVAANRREAVEAAVGPEIQGRFRAPGAAAWRGEIRRKPPTEQALEIEEVD